MRILFFSHQAKFIFGGEVVTLALARALTNLGFEVFFASPEGPYQERFRQELGARVHTIPSPEFQRSLMGLSRFFIALPRVISRLHSLLKFTQADLIHATSLKAMAFAWPFGFFRGVKVVWHHHDILPRGGWNDFWLRALAWGAAKIVTPSLAAKESLEAVGISGPKITAVWNGFDPAEWDGSAHTEPKPVFQILFVGELSKRKGVDFLIPIVEALHARGLFDFEIRVVGAALSDPDFARETEMKARGGDFPKFLKFLGRREDVKSLLREAQALILPSRQDPFPTVILEAAFSAVPILARPVGGVGEMFRAGEGGYFVDTPNDFATRLAHWAKHPEEARAQGLLARRFAEANFSVVSTAQKMLEVYKNC